MKNITITCSKCGEQFDLKTGEAECFCPHCGASNLIADELRMDFRKFELEYIGIWIETCSQVINTLDIPERNDLSERFKEIKETYPFIRRYCRHGYFERMIEILDDAYKKTIALGDDIQKITGKDISDIIIQNQRFRNINKRIHCRVFLPENIKLLENWEFTAKDFDVSEKDGSTFIDVTIFDGVRSVSENDSETEKPISLFMRIEIGPSNRISNLSYHTRLDMCDMEDKSTSLWKNKDIAKAIRFIDRIRGNALIEYDPYKFINDIAIPIFTDSRPKKGLQIRYLEKANELFGLYEKANELFWSYKKQLYSLEQTFEPDDDYPDYRLSDEFIDLAKKVRDKLDWIGLEN